MGNAIVKQPDGKYAIWSTICDNFIGIDGTKEEVLEFFADRARKSALESWGLVFAVLEKHGCGVGIKDYQECLEERRDS